jgi:predicted RNase H-like nuclease (RuvC/YqgF family)
MSPKNYQLEIQYCREKISSLHSEHAMLHERLLEVYREEEKMGVQLSGSVSIPRDLQAIEKELASYEKELDNLINEARQAEATKAKGQDLSPLEVLGMSYLLKDEGKLSDEHFQEIVKQVKEYIDKK